MSSVLGLDHFCPWPREGLSSKSRSFASDFFWFLALASNIVSSTPPLVKSNTVLSTARHRCNISSKGAVLLGRNDAEMGLANSLHASVYCSECNERFDLTTVCCMFKQIMSTHAIKRIQQCI